MVSTRMEGRVDTMETEMGAMKGEIAAIQVDITSIKEFMLEMKDSLGRLEGKKTQEHDTGGSRLEGEKEQEEERQEEEGGGENRERRRIPQGDDSGAERDNGRYRKLELPIFDGEDPIGWLFRVERYFPVNAVPGEEKLDAVAVCMEGKALNWIQWMEVRNPLQSWSGFKKELIRRFHQSQQGNGYEILIAHKQTSIVGKYREKFELLSAPLKEASEEMLVGFYQSGLKEEVRAELRMTQAQSLIDVMDMSQKIEERNEVVERMREEKLKKALKPIQVPKWTNGPLKPNFIKSVTTPASVVHSDAATTSQASEVKGSTEKKGNSTLSTPSKKNYRRLTDEEMKRKRERGECFTCDDKWSPAHQCKNKRINLIILSELEDEEDDRDEDVSETEGEREGNLAGTLMSLPLKSVVGIIGGRTMKLLGKINGKEALIMIDSGATHNFISTEFVKKLGLTVEKTKACRVTLGDGYSVQQEGKCRGVEIELQGLQVQENFYLFKLGDVDMILGMEWLESLGEVRVNWKQLTMKIKVDDGTVCLVGDPALAKSLVSMKNLIRSVRKGGNGFLLELNEISIQAKPEVEIDERIQKVLREYTEVCTPGEGLPPHRSRDHAILIKTGEQPPNIRPYRYPHSQKAEIEKLVQEMLTAGIYKPGSENRAADALSRRGADMELKAFSVWKYDDFEDWDKEIQQDEKLTRIKQQLITGTAETPGYSLQNGCLTFQNRVL
ncbi:Retrotransposable element Tf2 [Senna tora]|uniref:Retrotransposable element Tf2 n=1 Tax=Senna tora TaxID=362788 RepID=A0A834WHR4_9FABA|nr:Retrotransposable element Tf2 [Senna tora]